MGTPVTVLDFPEQSDIKQDDIAYVIRGTGIDRDQKERVDNLLQPLTLGNFNRVNYGGEVTEQSTPDMTAQISAGYGILNGKFVAWDAQSTATIVAPVSDTRLDYVCVDNTGTIIVIAGTLGASPDFPTVDASLYLILGALVIKTATTSINTGVEVFTFMLAQHPYFPNLYINSAYTATDKSHNNVIVDVSGDAITGTLVCQGNCWVADYSNGGVDGSGDALAPAAITLVGYTSDTSWTIKNQRTDGAGGFFEDLLDGSVASGTGDSYTPYIGNAATNPLWLFINAFNIYILNIDISGGSGGNGSTNHDPNSDDVTFPAGSFSVGSSGRNASNTANMVLNAVNIIEFLINSTVTLDGGNGGNGSSTSAGTVGDLGGAGGNAGDGGDITMKAKTITENGTITQIAGTLGSGGTGSGGSDNNANGSNGNPGSAGSKTSTEYDFTTGLLANYADWVHALYNRLLS